MQKIHVISLIIWLSKLRLREVNGLTQSYSKDVSKSGFNPWSYSKAHIPLALQAVTSMTRSDSNCWHCPVDFKVVLNLRFLSFLPFPSLLSLSSPAPNPTTRHNQTLPSGVHMNILGWCHRSRVIVPAQGNAHHGPPNSPRSSWPCINIPSLNQPEKTIALSSQHSEFLFWAEWKKK